jgi:hypothetical protein
LNQLSFENQLNMDVALFQASSYRLTTFLASSDFCRFFAEHHRRKRREQVISAERQEQTSLGPVQHLTPENRSWSDPIAQTRLIRIS